MLAPFKAFFKGWRGLCSVKGIWIIIQGAYNIGKLLWTAYEDNVFIYCNRAKV